MIDFYSSYGLVYIDNHRFYTFHLNERKFDLENTHPFYLKLDNKVFEEHTWGKLIVMAYNYLIAENELSQEFLLNFTVDWSKSEIFMSAQKNRTCFKLCNGLYVNTNHTSVHCYRLIQDFLLYLNYDLSNALIVISRSGVAEPNEVKKYIIDQRKSGFKEYLNLTYPSDKIKIIDNHFDFLCKLDDLFVSKAIEFRNHYSLFLIDYRQDFLNFKSDFLKFLKKKTVMNEKLINFSNKILLEYYEYFKSLY